MKERWLEIAPDADEIQEVQFDIWLSGKDISFSTPEAERGYRERVTLLKDAIQMKKLPQRVPVCPSAGFFPIEYAGFTMYDAMYDYDVLIQAWKKFCHDFTLDAHSGPSTIVSGRVLDILDYKLYKWPGHGVDKDGEYQFVEGEYMKAEEYQDLIDDPTGFCMNVYFPRVFGALKPLETMPILPAVNEIPLVPAAVRPFGRTEMQSTLKSLIEAGEETLRWTEVVRRISASIKEDGYPTFSGGFTKAPFDVIGDSLRGTKGVLLDMFRHPDELKEACERITPFMVKLGVDSCKASNHIMPTIPLHKGADGFMSDDQFREFYWPTLRKLIIGLINEGLVPQLFAEGGYNQRLEVISDIPKGKAVWRFDRTDMSKAKKTVGKVSCIAGNVPTDLLCAGSPDEMRTYCKNLIEDAGKDGGFILSTGASIQGATAANVMAMIETALEYGVYK
jgi:uroporphyrinogen-III decarboxylase